MSKSLHKVGLQQVNIFQWTRFQSADLMAEVPPVALQRLTAQNSPGRMARFLDADAESETPGAKKPAAPYGAAGLNYRKVRSGDQLLRLSITLRSAQYGAQHA